jgi:hypothetical protein
MSVTEIGLILGSIGTILGGGGWIRYFSERKKNNADAERTEVDMASVINQQWRELFDKYKEETELQLASFREYKKSSEQEMEKLRSRVEYLEQELEKEKARVKELEKNGHSH